MRNRTRRFSSTIGIAISLIFFLVLVVLVQFLPKQIATQQASQPVAQVIEATKPDSPLPTPFTPIVVVEPTWTPLPIPSPLPTATRNPNATLEPFPTKVPPTNASGVIFYSTVKDSKSIIEQVMTDPKGQSINEPVPLPVNFDFNPMLGSPSPDGQSLLLLKPDFPVGIPYIFDWKSQQIRPVFQNREIGGMEFGWHPDSQHFLFWPFGADEIWLVDSVKGEWISLAPSSTPPQGISIAPDGQTIVYGNPSKSAFDALWVVSALGSDAKILRDLQFNTYVFGWSPDGQHIAYMGNSSSANPKENNQPLSNITLSIVDPEGKIEQGLPLPFLAGRGFQPVWSPDGQWLAATGLEPNTSFGCDDKNLELEWEFCRFGGTAIYIQNIKTGEVKRLVSGIDPVWSPDGSMIAFLSNQSGTSEIWIIQIDGNNLQQLTKDGQIKQKFTWVAMED